MTRKVPRWMVVGFVVGGLASVAGLAGLILEAIEKVSRGQGHHTYRTFWEVEFNYFGVLVLFAGIALASMNQPASAFLEPTRRERVFNKAFGVLVGVGLGPRHYYLLRLRGRKTGRVYATPVSVVELAGKRFLVAPRGRTQWVRNAEAAGEVTLTRGRTSQRFRVRPVSNSEKPRVLSAYLDRFRPTVQRYFPVRAGSGPEAFAGIVDRYPVFELVPDAR